MKEKVVQFVTLQRYRASKQSENGDVCRESKKETLSERAGVKKRGRRKKEDSPSIDACSKMPFQEANVNALFWLGLTLATHTHANTITFSVSSESGKWWLGTWAI